MRRKKDVNQQKNLQPQTVRVLTETEANQVSGGSTTCHGSCSGNSTHQNSMNAIRNIRA